MKYDPQIHHRRSIRLKGYNYADGGEYFVTICAHRDAGKIFNPPHIRKIIEEEWRKCGEVRDDVFPGEYTIMPDHFHGLIRIAPGQSELGRVVGAFKAAVSRKIRAEQRAAQERATCVSPVQPRRGDSQIALSPDSQIGPNAQIALAPESRIWHRNYYERIIRSAEDRARTAKYIRLNPVKLQFRIDGMPAMGNPSLWELPKIGLLASGSRTGDPQVALSPGPQDALSPDALSPDALSPDPHTTPALLSGCHSGLEEQLARESTLPLIWMPAVAPDSVGFADWQLKALEAGRLLVVCPFGETHTTRENALQRNRIIAERCDHLWIPATRSGGSLEKLKHEFKHKNT